MASVDIGIDLGTATIIVYEASRGIVLKEPSVVAVNTRTGKILAVGDEAHKMLGRTPDNIRAICPLSDGVIADYEITQKMIQYFLHKSCGNNVLKPRVALCVPSLITGVESQAVVDAAVAAGARKVYLIEEPVAAAIGAGINVMLPNGNLVLDIGGGTSDIAVLSLCGIVCKTSIKMAGKKMDEAIIRHIKSEHNVLIGDKMAEKIKIEIGSVYPEGEEIITEAKGRNLLTGLPQKITVTRSEITDVLMEHANNIVDAIQGVMEKTPPELVGDIHTNGLVMTGGGSLLNGLDKLITKRLGIKANVAENPVECVAIGTGKSFDYLDKLYDGFINPSTHIH